MSKHEKQVILKVMVRVKVPPHGEVKTVGRKPTMDEVKRWIIQELSKKAKGPDQVPLDIAAAYRGGFTVIKDD
jgi:hypothetical protein